MAMLCAAAICVTVTACGQRGTEENNAAETETSQREWNGGPPQNILNTDFRNMVWGMGSTEIEIQEQRYEDCFGDHFIYFDDVRFGGFDSRLYYYFDEGWGCTSAAYMITLPSDSPAFDTAYDTVDNFLTELFAPPDEEGENVRTTRTAVIELTFADTDIERIISVKFSKPEGYGDEKYHSKVIYFDNGEPVGSSVYP